MHESIDLGAAAADAGISLGPNFQIKFQQYDNYAATTDGMGWDEIAILTPTSETDWYHFELESGATATIQAAVHSGSGTVGVELYDAGGNLIQTGASGVNVSSYVHQFENTGHHG